MDNDRDANAEWEERFEQSQQRGERFYENPPEPVTIDTLIAEAIVVDWPSKQWLAFIPPALLSQGPLADHNPVIEKVGMIATTPDPLTETDSTNSATACCSSASTTSPLHGTTPTLALPRASP